MTNTIEGLNLHRDDFTALFDTIASSEGRVVRTYRFQTITTT